MPFTIIKGTFEPSFGRPDGDSLRFVPDDPDPIFRLRRRGRAPKINQNNGSIQLRYEGIDTLETKAAEPFASDATRSNLDLAGTNGGTTNSRGYICSNQIGPNGRPIAFVFAGDTDRDDGSSVFLETKDIEESINIEQLKQGHAYPLYYDTLFRELREHCTIFVAEARAGNKGVWTEDASTSGFSWDNDLAKIPPIFPKLWRRLQSYARDDTFFDEDDPISNLKPYLESLKEERVLVLNTCQITGFDDLVKVEGGKARLLAEPENMVVISA